MRPVISIISRLLSVPAVFFLLGGCGTPRDTAGSRGMQNLTARYNILYNARLLLEESRTKIENTWVEDYTQVLPVFKEPLKASAEAEKANLDSVISKADKIILEKPNSNYVGAAYLLVAEADYLKTDFFSAAEFFDYVDKTYVNDTALRLKALLGKARASMQLDQLSNAAAALDTAEKHISSSKRLAAIFYAEKAQLLLLKGEELQAIEQLKTALALRPEKQHRLRWTFILGQLQERNGLDEEAMASYQAVIKSNAPFEMAFNASVNRISISEGNGDERTNAERLLALLKDDKNKDFADQIYYRIGNSYRESQQLQDAIDYYNKAVQNSTKNQNQKGLAYLQIAEIYFNAANYSKAKLYYDSTLAVLRPSYPGYQQIALKSTNLDFLAERLQAISREEMLQALARLPEDERDVRIGELVREQAAESIEGVPVSVNELTQGIDVPAAQTITEGKFYFNNTAALGQGFSDFKHRWGNRQLEDNWRRSDKTASEVTASFNNADQDASEGTASINGNPPQREEWLQNIPLTSAQLEQSHQRIIDAYFDIANFYRDELKDRQEAIRTFEELLSRYPDNSYKLAVYYNLYRLYEEINPAKAEEYKNLLLQKYPESAYAKIIADPSYGQKASRKEAVINESYNQVYSLYTAKDFAGVISGIERMQQEYGEDQLSPQWAYLEALAIGRTEKLPAFESALQELIRRYPEDKIVTPLSREHLEYIMEHREELAKRPTALADFDPSRPKFVDEPEPVYTTAQQQQGTPVNAGKKEEAGLQGEAIQPEQDETFTIVDETVSAPEKPEVQPPVLQNNLFSLPDSASYYFVVNVMLPRANLNSSRFGIGQFNRANYRGWDIKHQLKYAGSENQLIYIGTFNSRAVVNEYEKNILPHLSEIMKVPSDKYNTFVITQEDLNKLESGMMLSSYLEFYKNSK